MSVKVGDNVEFRNGAQFVLIAGPCQIESRDHALMVAERIADQCDVRGIPFVYKSSFDKANRTSATSARGVGIDQGLRILEEVRRGVGCPVTTDVHEVWQCKPVGDVVDIIQIPALLARQTDLIRAAGATGAVVNIKKGQYMQPAAMEAAAGKAQTRKVMLTERGTFFGYGNLVVDYRSLDIMRETGYPVIFDATHSVQWPSSDGLSSGGARRFVAPLARAAVAVGVAGVFIETHENPAIAPSDGPCMLDLADLSWLLDQLLAIQNGLRRLAVTGAT